MYSDAFLIHLLVSGNVVHGTLVVVIGVHDAQHCRFLQFFLFNFSFV